MPAPGSRFRWPLDHLVGREPPYLPFAEAFRPLGEPGQAAAGGGPQRAASEATLGAAHRGVLLRRCRSRRRISNCSHSTPISPLRRATFHAADASAARDRPGHQPHRPGAHAKAGAEGVRAPLALVLELGPLGRDELTALLAVRAGASLPTAVTDTIVARSEGNPFFAEELLAAAGDGGGELPRGLRDLLLQRVARLSHPAQALLRLAAAAGREVRYPLLRAITELAEGEVRDSLRQAVERGILVAEPADRELPLPGTRCWRRRSARRSCLGEREEEAARVRVAGELARSRGWRERRRARAALGGGGPPGAEALVGVGRSGAGRRRVYLGLAEAHSHLERALALLGPRCRTPRPGSTGLDLAEDSAPGAGGLAGSRTGRGAARGTRAYRPARDRARRLGRQTPHRSARALLQVRPRRILSTETGGGQTPRSPRRERAVELGAGGAAVCRSRTRLRWDHSQAG